MEKIIGYIIVVVSVELLLLSWKFRFSPKMLLRVLLVIVAVQFLLHLIRVVQLGWLISNKLGFQSLPPQNQYLLTEAASGLQPIIVGVLHAALWFALLWLVFLRRGKGAMLDAIDVQLLVLGLVAVGWPAGLVFLAGTFVVAVLGMLVLVVLRKKAMTDRLVITPYIIPAAILTLFFGRFVLTWTHLDKIRF